ncbi:hypothetical protein GPEL0_01r4502 [Geoanaerobacter pelophilus]|uniref:Uncharacterized protein n=1 Tax=Geoanaerobacter pelophilus TaxID=60036 RepID=A0ABQ0MPR7_9BACT|nr:hypothetical protein GPEL0_01r4502 [Geoanaerobacter pelophilus]
MPQGSPMVTAMTGLFKILSCPYPLSLWERGGVREVSY